MSSMLLSTESDCIQDLLFSCGIVVDMDHKDADIPMDSLMFISMIVEVENQYNVQIPSEMLLYKYWNSYNAISQNITKLQEDLSDNSES